MAAKPSSLPGCTVLHVPTLLIVTWACSIAYFDARYRRIPNVLSLGAWVLSAAVLFVHDASLTGASPSSALMGAGLGLLLTAPAYALRKLGAGDVKFLVAIGMLTSFAITLHTFLIAALLGGCMALLWLNLPAWASLVPAARLARHPGLAQWLAIPLRERRMAYGSLLSIGLLAALVTEH